MSVFNDLLEKLMSIMDRRDPAPVIDPDDFPAGAPQDNAYDLGRLGDLRGLQGLSYEQWQEWMRDPQNSQGYAAQAQAQNQSYLNNMMAQAQQQYFGPGQTHTVFQNNTVHPAQQAYGFKVSDPPAAPGMKDVTPPKPEILLIEDKE